MENKMYVMLGLVVALGLSAQPLAAARNAPKPRVVEQAKPKTLIEKVAISKTTKDLWNSGQKIEAVKNYFGFGEKKAPVSGETRDNVDFTGLGAVNQRGDVSVDRSVDVPMFDGPVFGPANRPEGYVDPVETFQQQESINRESSNRVLGVDRAPSVREVVGNEALAAMPAAVIASELAQAPAMTGVRGQGAQQRRALPALPTAPAVAPATASLIPASLLSSAGDRPDMAAMLAGARKFKSTAKPSPEAAPVMGGAGGERMATPRRAETGSTREMATEVAAARPMVEISPAQAQYNASRSQLEAIPVEYGRDGNVIPNPKRQMLEKRIATIQRANPQLKLSENYVPVREAAAEPAAEPAGKRAEKKREGESVLSVGQQELQARKAVELHPDVLPPALEAVGVTTAQWQRLTPAQQSTVINLHLHEPFQPGQTYKSEVEKRAAIDAAPTNAKTQVLRYLNALSAPKPAAVVSPLAGKKVKDSALAIRMRALGEAQSAALRAEREAAGKAAAPAAPVEAPVARVEAPAKKTLTAEEAAARAEQRRLEKEAATRENVAKWEKVTTVAQLREMLAEMTTLPRPTKEEIATRLEGLSSQDQAAAFAEMLGKIAQGIAPLTAVKGLQSYEAPAPEATPAPAPARPTMDLSGILARRPAEAPAPAPAAGDQMVAAEKFKKMFRVGMPREAVELKMRKEGLDPALLD